MKGCIRNKGLDSRISNINTKLNQVTPMETFVFWCDKSLIFKLPTIQLRWKLYSMDSRKSDCSHPPTSEHVITDPDKIFIFFQKFIQIFKVRNQGRLTDTEGQRAKQGLTSSELWEPCSTGKPRERLGTKVRLKTFTWSVLSKSCRRN